MIAKISSSNTLYGALAYNQNKVEADHAKVIFANRIIENPDGKFDISTCLQSFEPYIRANKRTEKPILHISLNPNPKDKLSDEQLSEIAQIYMQKMGYGDQPFIVYKHEDIERTHIHIVSVRVDENGKKIDHNYERRRSMKVCRDLELKYNLIPANEKKRQEELPLKPVKHDEGDIKRQITNVIRPIAKEYHFLSLKEYKALLSLYNVGVEEIRGYRSPPWGDLGGLGIVYTALNDRGEKVGVPFKSSLFGKSVGIEALEKRIEKSAETVKEKGLKERCKRVITSALRTANNRADFEKALKRQDISVVFRTNEQGRIYGATFIDHEQKCVFNGSRLGKEFSANVFNDKFSLNQNFHKIDRIDKISENKSCQSFNPENHSSDIGGIFAFPTSDNTGDEIAEQDLVRRLKKKRRPKRNV